MNGIVRFFVAVWRFIMCEIFSAHSWEVLAVSFDRRMVLTDENAIERRVVRFTVRECRRCERKETIEEHRRVARDWQYPERLFKKGA